MRRFPRREPEIAALAHQMVAGLIEKEEDFPSPPLEPAVLREAVDAYELAHNQAVQAKAAYALAVDTKDKCLKTLVGHMKLQLSYAEHAVSHDNSKLKALGWRKRRESSPMKAPGQTSRLEVVREGRGWVSLKWKKPEDGGPIAYYQLRVSHSGKSDWRDDARCFETATVLENQERGVELEYCVVAVNKVGEGFESNTVTVLL